MAYDSTGDSNSVDAHLQPAPDGWYALLKDRWYEGDMSSQTSEGGLTNIGGMTSVVCFFSAKMNHVFF